ncbi:MAG: TonB family protein [Candidatus Acidiferrum sp.]
MTPISKDVETLIATTTPAVPGTAALAPQAQASPVRPQPVPLEVPVSVNGARTIEGSDKREPFSESTKTVLVFANGAVIRLASSVSPGQLLFVTNEKSKKEVVCQVVKSKNYRTVTGYVELEFTEPAAGFWGVRIPTDAPAIPSTTAKVPVAARPAAPAIPKATAPKSPPVSAARPVVPPAPAVAKPPLSVAPPVVTPVIALPASSPVAAVPDSRPAPVAKVPDAEKAEIKLPTIAEFLAVVPPAGTPPSIPQPPSKSEALPAQFSQQFAPALGAELTPASDVKANAPLPGAPQAVTAPPPVAKSNSETSDELRQQATRLQEQLSSLLFRDEAAAKKTIQAVVAAEPSKELASAPKHSDQLSLPAPVLVPAIDETKPVPNVIPETKPASTTPLSKQFNLNVEEVKIPSWLAPLARETESDARSASTVAAQEGSGPESDAQAVSTDYASTGAEEQSGSPQTVVFGNQLLGGEVSAGQPIKESGSRKGVFLGLAAAAAIVIGGGLWYGLQQGSFLNRKAPAAQNASVSNVPEVSSAAPSGAAITPATAPAGSLTPPTSNPRIVPVQPTSIGSAVDASRAANPSASSLHTAPAVEEPKKPVLGDVHLATPTVNRIGETASNEAAPSIDTPDAAAASDPLVSMEASNRSEPALPVPVGGDVKPAQLLKSVPPVYPPAARAQRVAGDVKLDALIDASGNVTSTKILSGSPLLHLAAIAAVKQWKYQPAMLDGKPTAMHLTVTVQFRLQ